MAKTILVIEDDFDTLHPLAELLRLKGFYVITASDAERALEIAKGRRPDLIITDIVLPGKSGLHFISSVRKDSLIREVPIIVISGCGPMILIEAEAAGANFCLEKPINIDRFWSTIDEAFSINIQQADIIPSENRDEPSVMANEIDKLVEKLRDCASSGEKEGVLKELKERILEQQAKGRRSA
jgi:DNA-binding response OmpR family regulator